MNHTFKPTSHFSEVTNIFLIQKGYKFANSSINAGTGIKTICVNKKSSKNGSFGPTWPPRRVSNKCSNIFCGVPDITVYLKDENHKMKVKQN